MGISCQGKAIIPMLGELNPAIVDKALNNNEKITSIPEYTNELPGRPPGLCKGCPHGYVFNTLRELDFSNTQSLLIEHLIFFPRFVISSTGT